MARQRFSSPTCAGLPPRSSRRWRQTGAEISTPRENHDTLARRRLRFSLVLEIPEVSRRPSAMRARRTTARLALTAGPLFEDRETILKLLGNPSLREVAFLHNASTRSRKS